MVLYDRLVAAGDEDAVLDARGPRLVDDVLYDRPIDDGQHLLRDRLGRRQKAGAEPGNGKNGLADGSRRFRHMVGSGPAGQSSRMTGELIREKRVFRSHDESMRRLGGMGKRAFLTV
jgi:hypothetical protein